MTPRLALGVVLLALLGFYPFPGHTYLHSDTQIYVPMMEHLRDPALFTRDIMALRPHLAFTVYDEVAIGGVRLTGLSFQTVLQAEELLFRILAIAGLVLVARRLGLDDLPAWFAAGVVALGATIGGAAVLTFEYEPVPRGFAMCLVMLAMGFAAAERDRAAGIAGAAALLIHPGTALPFLVVAVLLVRRRAMLVPLVLATALLVVLARFQAGVTEATPLLGRLDPHLESMQRFRAAYSFVTTWRRPVLIDYGCQTALIAIAVARLWRDLTPRTRALLIGLPAAGIASFFFSWMCLEWQHWVVIPQWQPARAVSFVTLTAQILAAACGLRATRERRWIEAFVWLAAAFFGPMKHVVIGQKWSTPIFEVFAGLALLTMLAEWLGPRTRGVSLALAGVAAFFVIPATGLVRNYPSLETPEVDQLADWARVNTPVDAVFLFPDGRTGLEPGIFRVRASRALYVDWKSGGQVNYFPHFAKEWWKRWVETGSGRWIVHAADLPRFAERAINYIVVRAENVVPGADAAYRNARYVVYRIGSGADPLVRGGPPGPPVE